MYYTCTHRNQIGYWKCACKESLTTIYHFLCKKEALKSIQFSIFDRELCSWSLVSLCGCCCCCSCWPDSNFFVLGLKYGQIPVDLSLWSLNIAHVSLWPPMGLEYALRVSWALLWASYRHIFVGILWTNEFMGWLMGLIWGFLCLYCSLDPNIQPTIHNQ